MNILNHFIDKIFFLFQAKFIHYFLSCMKSHPIQLIGIIIGSIDSTSNYIYRIIILPSNAINPIINHFANTINSSCKNRNSYTHCL